MYSERATSKMKRRSIAPISESGSSQSFLVRTSNLASRVFLPKLTGRPIGRSQLPPSIQRRAIARSSSICDNSWLRLRWNAGICEIKLANDYREYPAGIRCCGCYTHGMLLNSFLEFYRRLQMMKNWLSYCSNM